MSDSVTVTEIPNLWPPIEVGVLSPAAILRAQASKLRQLTRGLVIAEIITIEADSRVNLSFDLVAPAIDNYRFRLLDVSHEKQMVYPAVVNAATLSYECWSQEEFIDRVGSVLGSVRTIGIIQSLIARSNDERETPSYPNGSEQKAA